MELELREVTPDVLEELRARVVLPPHEQEWVGGTVDDSLEDAADNPHAKPWPRAVYRDGVPVGFVMLSWDVEPDPPEVIGPWFLWKLMVAPAYQGQGVGAAIVRHVAGLVRAEGAAELKTSVAQGENTPYGFYLGLGFVPTGEYAEAEEEVLVLPL